MKVRVLKTLRKYLRPGGRMVVIDFSGRWPQGHESMQYTLAQLDAWMAGAGLSRTTSADWLENSFLVTYR